MRQIEKTGLLVGFFRKLSTASDTYYLITIIINFSEAWKRAAIFSQLKVKREFVTN
jgi:hypothetical protein